MKSLIAQRRGDFLALDQKINEQPLVYLDSAATSLKPKIVCDALHHFNQYEAANVHRGAHLLSDRATEKFENSRRKVQKFINAGSENEIIFTSGTTDSINLVAQTFGQQFLKAGDEIILTEMEHHSNIVPWKILSKNNGVVIKWAPVTDRGEIDLSVFKNILSSKTKFVSVVHCSNTLGTVNPIKEIIQLSHNVGAKVLVDAAQSSTFMDIDVQNLDCDFLAFSGHKLFGPFGIGVLFGKLDLLNSLAPAHGGGAMISKVTKQDVTFLPSPQRFEAGTPHISGVVGLGVAIDYVNSIGLTEIFKHESEILKYAVEQLTKIERVRFVGDSPSRVNILSFVVDGIHHSDMGQILDQQGVAVRAGHHCTQPLMQRMNITGTLRASFGIYNSREDVDIFIQSTKKAIGMLS